VSRISLAGNLANELLHAALAMLENGDEGDYFIAPWGGQHYMLDPAYGDDDGFEVSLLEIQGDWINDPKGAPMVHMGTIWRVNPEDATSICWQRHGEEDAKLTPSAFDVLLSLELLLGIERDPVKIAV
jgi:hypothetical protein